jgi:K+/H+ antiporter YhaU regulatory subunit KhtT
LKPKPIERIRYAFDNLMSKGVIALIGLLGIVTVVFIAAVALLVVVLGLFPPDRELDFPEAFWASLLRTLDPGTMGQDAGIGFRAAMLTVTLTGLIVVASLIGIISNAFNDKVEQLRKGRSGVLETNHTLLLGWNQKIHQIIHELVSANESIRGSKIVILADRDKVEMEDALKTHAKELRHTKLIARSGDPMSVNDLKLTRLDDARSIVILSPDDDEDADNFSIKTALAIMNNPGRSAKRYSIVGEIKQSQNLEVAELVGNGEVEWILGSEVISRLIVQTSRQSGLSAVFTDLLDFEGSELYLYKATAFTGQTYGEVARQSHHGSVLGIDRNGDVLLNPERTTKILAGDQLIVFAEDENQITFAKAHDIDESALHVHKRVKLLPERTLILGSNKSLPMVLKEIDVCAVKGSEVVVVDENASIPGLQYADIHVKAVVENPSNRGILEQLHIDKFDHIIVLADRERRTPEQADARTLLTLLNLRAMAKSRNHEINVVSEMLNDKNRELAESTSADDFIVSDKLVSNMITMVSENGAMRHILQSILSSDGAQVRLHPANWYVKTGVEVDYNTITEAALRRKESPLGYRLIGETGSIVMNPKRTAKVTFGDYDKIIVLSEE